MSTSEPKTTKAHGIPRRGFLGAAAAMGLSASGWSELAEGIEGVGAEAASQEDLNALSNKFSAAYGGATYAGMIGQDTTLPAMERLVLEATREILQNEEQAPIGETFSSGLRHFLAQPEFSDSSRARALLDAVEEQDFILDAISGKLADDGVRVMIGEENGREEIDDCSVILSRYGWPDRAGGFIAVLGPTRMKYDRSMAAARLMAQLMTSLAEDLG